MNGLDYAVLVVAILGTAIYGMWRTRGRKNLSTYLKGAGDTHWLLIGLSVMATQASAITFMSTPGQGYEGGMGFVQNYLGAPLALIIVSAVFLPIYRKLKVYTAYEYLGQRFDQKTRLLSAGLFLLQRGFGAGITIYAPAIVLSTVMGWRLDLTILGCGLVVIAYTVSGGSDAVTHTQKVQLGIIFAGMIAAFVILLSRLHDRMTFDDAFTLAGSFHKLESIDFSPDLTRRYTLWSGVIAGLFLQLSYFGTDQSQVQRYIGAKSLRESRLGLMFNAIFKIPMQVFILLLGTLLFVFYQVEKPPVFFNQTTWHSALKTTTGPQLRSLETQFDENYGKKHDAIQRWLDARHNGDTQGAASARTEALAAGDRSEKIRTDAKKALQDSHADKSGNDADYVFVTFILSEMPHGLIGLLIAAFFVAALSSKAGELNALASTTTVDIYRHLIRRDATDSHYLLASKAFIIFWGLVAIGFALFAKMVENLIQATNIVGSLFYGAVLGVFLVAFFFRRVGGTAVFWGAVGGQILVFILYFNNIAISYLWYNPIGCAACVVLALVIQLIMDLARPAPPAVIVSEVDAP